MVILRDINTDEPIIECFDFKPINLYEMRRLQDFSCNDIYQRYYEFSPEEDIDND